MPVELCSLGFGFVHRDFLSEFEKRSVFIDDVEFPHSPRPISGWLMPWYPSGGEFLRRQNVKQRIDIVGPEVGADYAGLWVDLRVREEMDLHGAIDQNKIFIGIMKADPKSQFVVERDGFLEVTAGEERKRLSFRKDIDHLGANL